MGMAASQARLLTITARIHDVEYQAQTIQNAKLQLATQSDQVYKDYQNALDETTMTITTINPESGEKFSIAATFANMFSKTRAVSASGKEYILKDSRNRVVVDEDLYNRYLDFKDESATDSAYMFALYMMDKTESVSESDIWKAQQAVYDKNVNSTDEAADTLKALREELVALTQCDEPESAHAIYDTNYLFTNGTQEQINEYKQKLAQYERILYGNYGAQIYEEMSKGTGTFETADDFDRNTFDYYVRMYNVIEKSNGCISIDDFNGFNSIARNDSEWLKRMIESGLMTIETVSTDKKGEITLAGTSPSSDENVSYVATTTIDKTALAKAEAKYEHDMKEVDKKDKRFDLSLSKLETERSALKTQYDTTKKVAGENVERTFKIFT